MSPRKFSLGRNEAGELMLDLDLVRTGRCLVQGSSGSGKSETIKKVCHATQGFIQSLIVDPEGEYAQLRSEMPFLLVGPGGEVAATLETAALLAIRLLETGVSAILDLSDLTGTVRVENVNVLAKREWCRRFLVALDTAPKALRRETLLFIDEAHIFAPEMGNSMDPVCASVADIASRGRKRGIAVVPVTQRLALLSNQIIGLCENLLIGRTGLLDAPRTAKLFSKTGKAGTEFIKQIGNLSDGQFYAYGRAFGLLEPVTFQVERVPGQTLAKAGREGRTAPPTPEQIRALLPQFAEIPQEVEKQTTTEADLRREIAALRKTVVAVQSSGGRRVIEAPAVVDRQTSKADKEMIRMLTKKLEKLGADLKEIMELHAAEEQKKARMAELGGELAKLATELGTLAGAPAKLTRVITRAQAESVVPAATATAAEAPAPQTPRATPPEAGPRPEDAPKLSVPQTRILNALRWLEVGGVEGPDNVLVAAMADYSASSTSYTNPRGDLKALGFIEYLGGGSLRLTESGRALAAEPDGEITLERLHDGIMAKLSAPQAKLLRALLDAYPEPMSSEDLAAATNYSAMSTSFTNPRGDIKKLGLADYPSKGMVVATSVLFPEALR